MQELQFQVILPPKEIFQEIPAINYHQLSGEELQKVMEAKNKELGGATKTGIYLKTVCPPEGGVFSYTDEHPYPRRGHAYIEAVEANNHIKRLTLGMLLPLISKELILAWIGFAVIPFKWKIRLFKKVLWNYKRLADSILTPHYLKPKYYNICSKELWNFVAKFLSNLGIEQDLADGIGKIAATLFEYEDGYRYRLEDIMSETSKEQLLNPYKEIKRLLAIYDQRELGKGIHTAHEKMTTAVKGISILLLHPKIKKAFIEAVKDSNIQNFQLDEGETYYCLNRPDYNFLGKPLNQRFLLYGAMQFAHQLKKQPL